MTATPAERGAESTWTRLRRRKVVQWGVVYVAAAWGFLQGLEYVSEAFHWPDQLRQIALIALLIGLPIVLVLAWYHGDRGQQRVTTPEFAILTLLLLLGGGAFWYYDRASETATVASPPSSTAAATATDRSIAVLPFVNMSTDKEQEYFADGISEELLNLLAQVPELRVIARTSSFSFKGKDVEIAEIARRLNVAHVLEGSVRKSGDKLRITAQLVRASDSSHLWSERYDRPLDDIFKVQDEIAVAVVDELRIKLLGDAPKTRATDPQAYELFLRARAIGNQYTAAAFHESISLYQQALARDPAYTESWVRLAGIYCDQVNENLRPSAEGMRLARQAIDEALALNPQYAPAHARLGWISIYYDRDLQQAVNHLTHALALDPANTEVMLIAAILSRRLGRWNQAIALGQYVVSRDPVSDFALTQLGLAYTYAGRFDDAFATYRTALALNPLGIGNHGVLSEALMAKGDAEAALAEGRQETDIAWRLMLISVANYALGHAAESDAALAELVNEYEQSHPLNIATALAFRGEADRAFGWLDRAAEHHDASLGSIIAHRMFDKLHDDPRWMAFLRKQDLAPEQLAAIKFDVKVPN